MDAAEVMTRLAHVIDAHDWNALASLLHPEFTCRLVHTGEVFDAPSWVRLNADYPGFQRFVLEDLVASGSRAVGRAHVTATGPDGEELVFAVASFVTTESGLVRDLTEVWTDVGQPPPADARPT